MRKHARVIPLLALAAAPLALAAGGCEAPAPTGPAEQAAHDAQPIVGGTVDNANDAVVAIIGSNGSMCTGTIIAKNGTTGYVLSAGHCKSSGYYILQADDYEDCIDGNTLDPSLPGCDEVYQSTGDQLHPQYTDDFDNQDFPGWDFLLIRFSGANANTPVIPADDGSANLQPGDTIEISGYGVMNSGGQLVQTSQRRHVTNEVDELYGQPPLIEISQNWSDDGGACSGDSGGPALKNGRVVGVTSFGDQDCQYFGYSAFVELVYPWIADYIGADVPEQTCDECAQSSLSGSCAGAWNACVDDAACNALLQCFQGCSTDACYQGCANDNPGGLDLYNAAVDCAYCDACDSICNADFCGGGSGSGPAGSGPTGSGVGVTTGSGDAVGATTGSGDPLGGGGAGAGGAPADEDDDDDDDDDGGSKDGGGDEATADGTSCTVGAVGAGGGSAWVIAAAAMALLTGRRRRG